MNFKPLASGSTGNCYTVDGSLMLECGIRIKEIRAKNGFSIHSLEGALVSHEHGDHASGVHDILKAGVDIYMSRGTAKALEIEGHHRLHIIKAGEQFVIGNKWTILPFETIHEANEPLGFLVANGRGEKLVFATDTQYIKHRFQGLTHIAVEANYGCEILRESVKSSWVHPGLARTVIRNHQGVEALKRWLRMNDLSQMREIHLLHLSNKNSDADGFRGEIMKLTGKPVYIA